MPIFPSRTSLTRLTVSAVRYTLAWCIESNRVSSFQISYVWTATQLRHSISGRHVQCTDRGCNPTCTIPAMCTLVHIQSHACSTCSCLRRIDLNLAHNVLTVPKKGSLLRYRRTLSIYDPSPLKPLQLPRDLYLLRPTPKMPRRPSRSQPWSSHLRKAC
jgi:hypothetical protein